MVVWNLIYLPAVLPTSIIGRTRSPIYREGHMKNFWQDLLYGCRMLIKTPGFTIVAALSLALGIGANTVVFSLINTTLLRPLPFADSGKLMVLWTVPLKDRTQQNAMNVSSYFAIRDKSQTLESLGALNNNIKNLGAEKD